MWTLIYDVQDDYMHKIVNRYSNYFFPLTCDVLAVCGSLFYLYFIYYTPTAATGPTSSSTRSKSATAIVCWTAAGHPHGRDQGDASIKYWHTRYLQWCFNFFHVDILTNTCQRTVLANTRTNVTALSQYYTFIQCSTCLVEGEIHDILIRSIYRCRSSPTKMNCTYNISSVSLLWKPLHLNCYQSYYSPDQQWVLK